MISVTCPIFATHISPELKCYYYQLPSSIMLILLPISFIKQRHQHCFLSCSKNCQVLSWFDMCVSREVFFLTKFCLFYSYWLKFNNNIITYERNYFLHVESLSRLVIPFQSLTFGGSENNFKFLTQIRGLLMNIHLDLFPK